ncbi:MAG: hypothetical protein R3330_19115, partial [Saprospiraceae bacterium]|nr:hypothetical protein [Saprospiraceae bacterium]
MKTVDIIKVPSIIALCMLSTYGKGTLAALSAQNDPVFGNNSITTDSETGLDWLDLGLSTGKTVAYVSSQFGTGGAYDGFRHATRAEVLTLFHNAGIPDIDTGATTANNYLPVSRLILDNLGV